MMDGFTMALLCWCVHYVAAIHMDDSGRFFILLPSSLRLDMKSEWWSFSLHMTMLVSKGGAAVPRTFPLSGLRLTQEQLEFKKKDGKSCGEDTRAVSCTLIPPARQYIPIMNESSLIYMFVDVLFDLFFTAGIRRGTELYICKIQGNKQHAWERKTKMSCQRGWAYPSLYPLSGSDFIKKATQPHWGFQSSRLLQKLIRSKETD